MTMKRLLTAVTLTFFSLCTMLAQNPMLRNYRMTEYRGGTQNWCIDKTGDNRLLLANNQGLLEFDSHWWRLFPLKNHSIVRSILFDKETRNVWAGGSGEFGYYTLSAKNYSVEYHSLSDSLPTAEHDFDEIWRIMKMNDGSIVFQGKSRIFVYLKGKMRSIATPFIIECMGVVGEKLMIASHNDIYLMERGQLKRLEGTEVLRGTTIRAILSYGGKTVFATTTHGLFRYDGEQTVPFLETLTPFIARNHLFCAAIQNEQLAIGTVRNGMLLYNIKTGQTYYANSDTGLQNNTVLSLRFDEQQNIWLGLDQGVSYVMPGFPSSYLLSNNSPIGTGYASLKVQNQLYLGSNQGLFTIPYPLVSSPTPPIPQPVEPLTGQIWRLKEIGGTLFCGCDAGTYIVKGQSATKINGPEGTWNYIPLSNHPDLILGCDYKGLFLLRNTGGHWQFDGRVEGFGESSIDFLQDSDGAIWFSHWQKGVYRLTLSADARKVVNTQLFSSRNGLLVDNDNMICRIGGTIYVSSVNGFFCYDAKSKKLKRAENINRIFNTYGVSLRIYETPSRHLWAYKTGFLAEARPNRDGSYDVDSTCFKNVERDLQMALGHPCFLEDNRAILNSINGFVLVNGNHTIQQHPERIIFQGITGTNHGDTLLYACNPMPKDYVYRIPHEQNSIRFSFVMPEYARPKEIVYSYWLEGYDKDWSTPQTIGEKEYTHLAKGKYVFHLRAKNRITGVEDEQSIIVSVEPAWYETWWAYILYIIIAGSLLWIHIRWAQRLHRRKMSELAAKKEEEMRRQEEQFRIEKEREEERFRMEQERKEMQLREQQARLEAEEHRRKNEVAQLQKEQLENELKHRQSELADSTMNLMRKNDMLQTLDEQMDQLSESVRREDAKAKITQKIKEIRHDIQQNINEDEGWDKFEENFNLVYDNFMKRLTGQFPDLKMNDRRLCAYLRMGLSSKEMASLLNTSVRSIETARYRLRKKLDMEQGDNLTEFIQNF